MKPGSSLGLWALLAVLGATAPAGAQNLGLGAGSRSASDSAREYRSGGNEDSPAPRRQQMNKRLGLTARRNAAFDPKIFEARGRELQGQFYEIGTPVTGVSMRPGAAPSAAQDGEVRRKGSRQWMIWAGVAGAVGVSAGAAGYLLLTNAHPTAPPPVKIEITDDPP